MRRTQSLSACVVSVVRLCVVSVSYESLCVSIKDHEKTSFGLISSLLCLSLDFCSESLIFSTSNFLPFSAAENQDCSFQILAISKQVKTND